MPFPFPPFTVRNMLELTSPSSSCLALQVNKCNQKGVKRRWKGKKTHFCVWLNGRGLSARLRGGSESDSRGTLDGGRGEREEGEERRRGREREKEKNRNALISLWRLPPYSPPSPFHQCVVQEWASPPSDVAG